MLPYRYIMNPGSKDAWILCFSVAVKLIPIIRVKGPKRDPERDLKKDPEQEFMPAGQSVGAIGTLVPAAEIVSELVETATAALAAAGPKN